MYRKIFEGGAETGEGAERCREKKLDREVQIRDKIVRCKYGWLHRVVHL
jgi:hypothetical protein